MNLNTMTANPHDVFDEFARQAGFGGLFKDSLTTAPFNRVYAEQRSRFEAHVSSIERIRPADMRLKVAVEFANSPELNAFTFAHKDQYFVGVPFGTVLILNDYFLRIMASRDVLLDVGKPTSQ